MAAKKKRTKITEEMGADIIRRNTRGESKAAIGRVHKLDYRTVQNFLKKAAKEGGREHWEAVSRQVDVKHLDEHYRLLLRLGMGLLDAVYQEPIEARGGPSDPQTVLGLEAERTVYRSSDLFRDRGVDLGQELRVRSDAEKAGLSRRFAQRLLNALWEHEPQLERAFGNWKTRWDCFRKVEGDFLDEAGGLFSQKLERLATFRQKGTSDDDLKRLRCEVVREVLGVRFLGEKPKSSRVEVNRDTGRADLVRYNQTTESRVYGGFGDAEAIREAYEWVFKQMSHEERLRPVEDAYGSLKGCIPQVEELVDDLVLRGRPRGQCDLCRPV